MGSLAGSLQRPFLAASAVAVASVSTDLHDKFMPSKLSDTDSSLEQSTSTSQLSIETNPSRVSQLSISKLSDLSFVARIRVPVPYVRCPVPVTSQGSVSNSLFSSAISSPVLLNLYSSAELASAKPTAYTPILPVPPLSEDVLYKWHLPQRNTIDTADNSDCSLAKSRTVVVLLGWLGAKQKHMRKYAEYYTSRGFHVITFTFPMSEILSYQAGWKAEEHVDLLVNHLSDWLEEEHGNNLVFHTFSNTGWLTYGAILEKFQQEDDGLIERIKGCIVDSAPVAAPDPQVWAAGFSAAILKKQSVATKQDTEANRRNLEVSGNNNVSEEVKPAFMEAALQVVLERVFEVVLKLPAVDGRLSSLMGQLKSRQPSCPQLYIYSSADKVIPAEYVESFITEQQRIGHQVRSCNFISTPHVDHLRNDPELYTSQLTQFLEDCMLCCKQDPNP
ncbi:hypothetical protein DCAR_0102726 [Daucus carota subsp. sativus]|uniref:Uncharacterized protein n=1 Tax=Daucus carota subsp. sativus TaxID=79200 RepID=A0A166H8U2_DAUCS|nr:PREDICTED: transmembrane protein 53 [Daucus carota subsp. sativus]XP_017236289.1 PREDICTED: transmembrane protein 53 [Daucus carota subsp. sativus]XP_017236298.1 PREDICTED: transmembrane protein 53 [Daucus carota subsp. sativus]WOG83550.1 hypothetical protein DCAR_0102726 [Daucus carota subsp. sativus]